jgi:tetratricopeptide (TPR) repeat protein
MTERAARGPIASLRPWLSRRSSRQRLALLFGFALAVRVLYLTQIEDSPFFGVPLGDGQAYDAWAVEIGRDFWGKQAFFQAPLYPYFLAAIYGVFGHDLLAVRELQLLLGASSCVLLARATSCFFSERIGLLSGLVLAVYGPALFFDGIVQKSSVDLFLGCWLLFCLARAEERDARRFPALAGVALGCLALTRETALIWAPCLLLWFALRVQRSELAAAWRRQMLPFCLGIALVLAPVALRNYAVSGQFFLTTSQFGQNFYIGNNPTADGTYQSLRFGHGGAAFERQDALELAEAASGRKLNRSEVSSYWSGRAWQFIEQHPIQWLGLLLKKSLLVWSARELPDSDEPLVYADTSWLLRASSWAFGFATLFPLSLAGAASPRGRPRLLLFGLLSLSLAASTALFFVNARYRYPLVPLLIPFAVVGVSETLRSIRTKDRALLLKLGAAAAIGLAIAGWDLAPRQQPRATAYYDLGVSLEGLGRPRDAVASYRQALLAHPDFVEAHINLGSLLAQNGDFDEAAAHERAALKLRPDDALAHANLGNILLEGHQLADAARHYQRALELDPSQPQAKDGLAALNDELRQQLAQPHTPQK